MVISNDMRNGGNDYWIGYKGHGPRVRRTGRLVGGYEGYGGYRQSAILSERPQCRFFYVRRRVATLPYILVESDTEGRTILRVFLTVMPMR
jgi:hypothetical protein